MYARVSRYEGGSPENLEESVLKGREQTLPAARDLPGFAGAIVLLDRRSGKHMTISLWDNEEAMLASEEEAKSLRASQLTKGEHVSSVERFEVAMLTFEHGLTA